MPKNRGQYVLDMKNLCTPAMVYFVISAVGMLMIGIQNLNGKDNTLCIGTYNCSVASKSMVFILNTVYILFWTFVLDLFCKSGYKDLSWFIVFIPIVLAFVLLGAIVVKSKI